jgi:hypothetical protein
MHSFPSMTPLSKMCRERAAELKRQLDLEPNERKALAIAKVALVWLEIAEADEQADKTA